MAQNNFLLAVFLSVDHEKLHEHFARSFLINFFQNKLVYVPECLSRMTSLYFLFLFFFGNDKEWMSQAVEDVGWMICYLSRIEPTDGKAMSNILIIEPITK